MQMVYEQDVDLGFDWQHLNEANKPLKDLSKNQTDKNMIVSCKNKHRFKKKSMIKKLILLTSMNVIDRVS